ncbi:organomercurial lyase [Microbacterium pumilum]|uniref:Organomercurial lyase n=1 Tax=Microbacterium pumilum TaxID=344165 RepID=A0ABN2RZT7_9MICO
MTDAESLRLRIYGQLAAEGRVDGVGALAVQFSSTDADIQVLLGELAAQRHLVLAADGIVELAHPFGTRDFGFSVKSDRTLWWGGCAWDSFAIPHLVPHASPALVATTCPNCGAAHAWNVDREHPPEGSQVAHFLTPMAHVWDDVIHACENQRIFCDEVCVDGWLGRTGSRKGSVFDIPTLWRLASHWYDGRLSRGYRRREPVEAATYFRDAGLSGSFWGN